jgi:hypothetical protein
MLNERHVAKLNSVLLPFRACLLEPYIALRIIASKESIDVRNFYHIAFVVMFTLYVELVIYFLLPVTAARFCSKQVEIIELGPDEYTLIEE